MTSMLTCMEAKAFTSSWTFFLLSVAMVNHNIRAPLLLAFYSIIFFRFIVLVHAHKVKVNLLRVD